MSTEDAICLIKGAIVPKTHQGWFRIPCEEFLSIQQRFSTVSSTSKKLLPNVKTLFVEVNLAHRHNHGYLILNCNLLKAICNIWPNFFIEVAALVKFVELDQIIFNRRFYSTEFLKLRGYGVPIFEKIYEYEMDISVDIIIKRWDMCQKSVTPTSLLRNLYRQELSKDLKIVAGNGAEVKCHKIIFEAHSNVFAAMVSSDNGMKESQTGTIEMRENSEEGVRRLTRYLYDMELNTSDLSCELSVELFILGHKYELKDLQDCLGLFLLQKEDSWFSPDSLLELYFYVKNLDEFKNMEDRTLAIIMRLSREVRNCERFKELNKTDPVAAADLLWTLFDLK